MSWTSTTSHADACDRQGSGQLVHVSRSDVCPGIGVFASIDAPAGTAMTAYPFVQIGTRHMSRARKGRNNDYAFDRSDGTSVDGHPQLLMRMAFMRRRAGTRHRRRYLWGCANLANDAIHHEVTGRHNNCKLAEHQDGRIYLVTTRHVRKDEELLVPYSLDYWMTRASRPTWTADMKEWLDCQVKTRHMLRPCIEELHEYLGIVDTLTIDDSTLATAISYVASYATGYSCRCAGRVLANIEVRWHSSGNGTMVARCTVCSSTVCSRDTTTTTITVDYTRDN